MIAIVGPTASGKTHIGLHMARERGGEIISLDSRQVYRYLAVGTDKPTGEWISTSLSPPNASIGGPSPSKTTGSPITNFGDDGMYVVDGIPYHLVDIWNPDKAFSAADFVKLAAQKVVEIRARKKIPIFVGGAGLYLKAYLEGLAPLPPRNEALRAQFRTLADSLGRHALHEELRKVDPAAAAKIPANNIARVIRALEVYELTGKPISQWHEEHQDSLKSLAFKNVIASAPSTYAPKKGARGNLPIATNGEIATSACPINKNGMPPRDDNQTADRYDGVKIIGLSPPRAELHDRIARRCRAMLENGLIEETENLLRYGYATDCPALTGLGYPRVVAYLAGRLSKQELLELLIRDTRQYAKRQMTWFRNQMKVEWANSYCHPEERSDEGSSLVETPRDS